ncbi:MAG: GNAT family N-acetyltransferase [Clostridia bacterium]|nr:GNAT family N-acetyltransferase [Clostridia bacterium]
MKLIEPTMDYDRQIQAYRSEFLFPGASMDGGGGLRKCGSTAEWLALIERLKRSETAAPEYVRSSQYIYVREEDEKIVGVIQIRHELNEYLKKFGGHIGYSVAPSERRKGYATRMLAEALGKCREAGLTWVLITCFPENEGSRRTIQKNGGVYLDTIPYEDTPGQMIERYRIDL